MTAKFKKNYKRKCDFLGVKNSEWKMKHMWFVLFITIQLDYGRIDNYAPMFY